MKALVVTENGGPDRLKILDWPEPRPAPGEVLIKVEAAGINFAEVMARRGDLKHLFEPPFVPGLEVAGEIAALGEGVAGLALGEHVIALTGSGGLAEYAVAPAAATVQRDPAQLPVEVAAAAPVVVPTALLALDHAGRVGVGDTVLVHAASGGLGLIAAQVARLRGAETLIGTVGAKSKSRVALDGGYDVVVERDAFILDPQGSGLADVAIESIGGPTRRATLESLAPLGRMVVLGNASGETEELTLGAEMRGASRAFVGLSILGLASQRPDLINAVTRKALGLLESGTVAFPQLEVVKLDDVAEIHGRIESRSLTGKVVARI